MLLRQQRPRHKEKLFLFNVKNFSWPWRCCSLVWKENGMLSISYSVPNTGVWFYSINKVNPLVFLFPDYSGIQSEFSLCKPPSTAQDIHQLNGLLRNAFTLMAMLDYPYSTHFMGNMPANPVKVQTARGRMYTLFKTATLKSKMPSISEHHIYWNYFENRNLSSLYFVCSAIPSCILLRQIQLSKEQLWTINRAAHVQI